MNQVSQINQTSNVVSFSDFKNKQEPLPTPVEVLTFGNKSYPCPSTGEEYLALVKSVFIDHNLEEYYRELLCAIMDDEYYQANYNYFLTPNSKHDKHLRLYSLVDAYWTFP